MHNVQHTIPHTSIVIFHLLYRNNHLPKNGEPAELYNTIDPMLAKPTKFSTILSEIQKRHKDFSERLEKDSAVKSSLALKFPSFTCEVKVDGERMLTHMKKDAVRMQVSINISIHFLTTFKEFPASH